MPQAYPVPEHDGLLFLVWAFDELICQKRKKQKMLLK
jgi:hypothetical protein